MKMWILLHILAYFLHINVILGNLLETFEIFTNHLFCQRSGCAGCIVTPRRSLECILRKNVFDKRWVSIFSTLTKFEQHVCLQIDEMSNFTCYLQSLVPGKVYVQNMYITIHK